MSTSHKTAGKVRVRFRILQRRGERNKRPSGLFAAITGWIESGTVKKKLDGTEIVVLAIRPDDRGSLEQFANTRVPKS